MGICAARALLVAVVLVGGAKVAFVLGILGVATNAVGGNRDVEVGVAGANRGVEGRAVGKMVGVGATDWGTNAGVLEATLSRIVDRGVATAAKKGVTRGFEDAGVDTGAAGGTRNGALVVVVADVAAGVTFAKRGKA